MLLCLLLAVAGCGDPHPRAGRPVDARHCSDLPFLHGDPGMLVGTHWSGDRHRWGAAVTVYACADPHLHGSVTLSSSDSRIRIRPATVALGSSGSGVYAFEVTPARGASGGLMARFEGHDGGFGSTVRGPRVAGRGDGWHLVAPTD